MKLVTFQVQTPVGNFARLGAVFAHNTIVDLNFARARIFQQNHASVPQKRADVEVPSTMLDFLDTGTEGMLAAAETLQTMDALGITVDLAKNPTQTTAQWRGIQNQQIIYTEAQVTLLAPLPRPRSLRDFLAFEGHAQSGFARRGEPFPKPWYQLPVFYKGNVHTVVGAQGNVEIPFYTQKMDYELEVACVVNKEIRDASVEEAQQAIAGYMIMNDFSARDIQADEVQCRMGPAKGKDFATALGPWLVTDAPENLTMKAFINDQQWSSGNLSDAYWNFAEMISYVSQGETVYPGDVFGSGTCTNGCGLELGKFLKAGDKVRLEIDHLGIMEHTLVPNPKPFKPLQEMYAH